jgi:hypothetical protein
MTNRSEIMTGAFEAAVDATLVVVVVMIALKLLAGS